MIRKIIFLSIFILISSAIYAISRQEQEAELLKQKADAYYNADRLPEALEYYTIALDKAKSEKNDSIYNACIGNIGNIYAYTGGIRHAVYYFIKGYKASVKKQDVEMQSKFLINIVKAYCLMGDAANAKKYFKLQTQIPLKDKRIQQYFFLSNQALIANVENNKQMTEYYMKSTLDYARERNMDMKYIVGQLSMYGDYLLSRGNYQGAIEKYSQCLDSLCHTEYNTLTSSIYKKLSVAYDSLGNHQEAQRLKQISLVMNDSIFDRSQMEVATNKLFEYENYENQMVIDELMFQNTAKLIALIMTLLLLVTLGIFFIMLKRKNKSLLEAQNVLVGKNKELQTSEKNNKALTRWRN